MFHFFSRSTENLFYDFRFFLHNFFSSSSPRDGLLSFKHSEKCRNSKKLGGWVDSVIVKGKNVLNKVKSCWILVLASPKISKRCREKKRTDDADDDLSKHMMTNLEICRRMFAFV